MISTSIAVIRIAQPVKQMSVHLWECLPNGRAWEEKRYSRYLYFKRLETRVDGGGEGRGGLSDPSSIWNSFSEKTLQFFVSDGVFFLFLRQRPVSWQGLQQYQQLSPLFGDGNSKSATVAELDVHQEASRAKQVGSATFYGHWRRGLVEHFRWNSIEIQKFLKLGLWYFQFEDFPSRFE